jgi:hypothetical protein
MKPYGLIWHYFIINDIIVLMSSYLADDDSYIIGGKHETS